MTLVTAIAGREKMDAVRALGCDRVLARDDDAVAAIGAETVDRAGRDQTPARQGLSPGRHRRGATRVSEEAPRRNFRARFTLTSPLVYEVRCSPHTCRVCKPVQHGPMPEQDETMTEGY